MDGMKRAIISTAILLVLTCGARPAQAASIPFIDVAAFGVELCQQSVCGSALFAGVLFGNVGINPSAVGVFVVAINHQTPLPVNEGDRVFITGGAFDFRFGLRRIRGAVRPFGILESTGDNTFTVVATLETTEGDLLDAVVILDHNVFPPRVVARVTSAEF